MNRAQIQYKYYNLNTNTNHSKTQIFWIYVSGGVNECTRDSTVEWTRMARLEYEWR